jgi:hypothetical protein
VVEDGYFVVIKASNSYATRHLYLQVRLGVAAAGERLSAVLAVTRDGAAGLGGHARRTPVAEFEVTFERAAIAWGDAPDGGRDAAAASRCARPRVRAVLHVELVGAGARLSTAGATTAPLRVASVDAQWTPLAPRLAPALLRDRCAAAEAADDSGCCGGGDPNERVRVGACALAEATIALALDQRLARAAAAPARKARERGTLVFYTFSP